MTDDHGHDPPRLRRICPFCALREEGYGMAQGMNKLNEALASLPEVRELLLSLDAGTSPIAVSGLSG